MDEWVDPFIGSAATQLPEPTGLAATWWSPKPLVGNTHPGATYPFGMVSACAYSGAYPTGYGVYDLNTEGVPTELYDRALASGITHFQQSGTGAIRKYYNYVRVTPMLEPLDALGRTFALTDEEASPGYYAATFDNGVRAEVTVGPKSAVHRYTFPRHHDARIVVDLSHGGLQIPHGATVPLRADMRQVSPTIAEGQVVMEGAPLAFHLECDTPHWRQLLWYDRRLMHGSTRLDFDAIRPTTLRPFGVVWAGPVEAGQTVELRIGFSLRGPEKAAANLVADGASGPHRFAERRRVTAKTWRKHLRRIEVSTPSADRRTVMATALYHSLIKPSFAAAESPFWPSNGPFAFDISTMWDIYRTQLPLITALFPDRSVELATALLTICEQEGNFPIGYRMAIGSDRFARQASALAHTLLSDLCLRRLPGIDWAWALVHMHNDLRRTYGEDYLLHGFVEPASHTLDLAFGYWCTAQIARYLDDEQLVREFRPLADGWRRAFDDSGLLRGSTFYEGTRWNYSFRLLHDMDARIRSVGGDDAFVALLDRFFGFGADPVTLPGVRPNVEELEAGYALGRFEGLNNEPDMDAPWAYQYAGRPDRTADIVHAAVMQRFGPGPGGLPGNDDSGGLSSWYVWASLGLFPVAGQNITLLNAPSYEDATLHVGENRLEIGTRGFREPDPAGRAQYVQSVHLNGVEHPRPWLTGAELAAGGQLVVSLGDEPSAWGTTVRPPSFPLTEPTPT